jgi:hypothetical protein
MIIATGRRTGLPDLARLRRACLATLIALVAEFGLGMWLNLYVPVPSADQHAGFVGVITNGPLLLTVHALVGMFLIGAAIVLTIRAVRALDTQLIALTSGGLGAVLGAFVAGEFFARDGEARTSLWMALFTGIALLCYIRLQAITTAARMAPAHPQPDAPPEPASRPSYGSSAVRPRPVPAHRNPASGPQRAYPPATSDPWPAYPPATSGPRPAYPPAMSGPRPAYPRPEHPRPGQANGFPWQPGPENTWQPWQPAPEGFAHPEGY